MENNKMMATNETYEAALKVLERKERSLYPNVRFFFSNLVFFNSKLIRILFTDAKSAG